MNACKINLCVCTYDLHTLTRTHKHTDTHAYAHKHICVYTQIRIICVYIARCTDERNSGGGDVHYTPTADNFRILY
jgi:hypothetical protein